MVFAPKVEPRPYQRHAVAWLARRGHGALLLDTRTGKTKIAIDWLSWLAVNRGVRNVVLIVPKIGMTVWEDELEINWWGPRYMLYATPGKWAPRTAMQKIPAMRVFIVNYERFSVASHKVISQGIKALPYDETAIVLDESHVIKTPSSARSRRIVPLGKHARYRAILTATPVSKRGRVDEVYPQWCFMDPSIRDKWPTARDFRYYFGEWDESEGYPQFVRPLHTAEYAQLIADSSIAVTREAALGIDPVEHHVHRTPMPAGLQKLYKAMVKDKALRLEAWHVEPPEHVFSKFTLARRMASGIVPRTGDKPPAIFPDHKITPLVNLLGNEKTIVCCNFLAEIDAVVPRLERAPGKPRVFVVTGETKDKPLVLEAFRAAEGKAVLVVQPSVVSVAVDLACASRLLWLGPPTSWILFKQMSDRIALNPMHPESHVLVTPGTSDESLHEALVEARGYRARLLKAPEKFLLGKTNGRRT